MRIIAPLAAAWLGLAALPAAAQVNPFRGATTALGATDSAMFWSSVEKLNRLPDLAVGSSTSWRDSATGSSGENRVTGVSRRNGMTCHTVRHQLLIKGRTPPSVFNVTWCLAPDGAWKIAS